MKIYSIKEIVEATNNIFNSKNNKLKKNKSIIVKPKSKDKKIQKPLILKPLILKNEPIIENNIQLNTSKNKTSIEIKDKDHMISELYLFMKKKGIILKNTIMRFVLL